MKIVGLTGGMGSGKTTVAGYFKDFGIPVYIADEAAKNLQNTSEEVKKQIRQLLGEQAYSNGKLDRKYVASEVFSSKEKLERLNAIVHPAVAADFEQWKRQQVAPYVIYEAAILFESGGFKKCDYVILVTAPYEERVKRLKERDRSNEEEIRARMQHQWSDERKRNLADYEIINIERKSTWEQAKNVHEIMLKGGEN